MYAGQRDARAGSKVVGDPMSAPSSNGGHGGSGRRCQGCGSSLAADNTARLCSKCHRELRDQLRTPPAHMRNEFFETPEFLAAFESQHIGKVFKVFRNHSHFLRLYGKALNQEVLGRWLGLTQAQVSKLENGKPERNLDNLINYARALHLPEHLLWFKFPGQKLRMPQSPSTTQVVTAPNGLVVSQPPDELLVANTGMDTLELLRRVRSSAINTATIDALDITVKQLCCDYSHADASALMKQGQQWLNNMIGLLDKRLTLSQHREILNNAGMLALLVGCLENDLGDSRTAEATRRMALELGKESGKQSIVGWAHEMLSWFHLTAGNYRAVIAAAEAGVIAAPNDSVAVQLFGQQGKAYARMGQPEKVREALENGSNLLATLPYPERPENHFVVDPDKWDFYAMDTYRIVGEDELAKRNAEEVIRRSSGPDGVQLAPMRASEAQLTLGVIAAREGEIEQATALGIQALETGRQSRPSLLMVGAELEAEMDTYGAEVGADFRELLNSVRRGK